MMFRKKDKRFFGNDIAPDCAYCAYGSGTGESIRCSAGAGARASGPCPRFRYDPLKRAPDGTPELPKHTPEDFTL